jgi:chromosome segregation ATPase
VLAGSGVYAQDANAQKNALAKAQFMLRQSTAEKAELQQQADTLKQQVEKLAKELAATQGDAGATQQKMQTGFAQTIDQWRQRDARQTAQLQELRLQLKVQGEQRAVLDQRLEIQASNFSVCYGNNKQLVDLNRELLERYQNKGVFAAMRQKEPFTGLAQVEVENLVQDYRYKLDDLTVNAPEAAP